MVIIGAKFVYLSIPEQSSACLLYTSSDGMEQMIILGHGAERISATELHWEVEQANEHIEAILKKL